MSWMVHSDQFLKRRRELPKRRALRRECKWIISIWHDVEEDALEPAHGLGFVDEALAAVLDARIGHLGRQDGVAATDLARVDHAREADEFGALVDQHLLLAA